MLIEEVARRAGVNAKTLRYYENIGLLARPVRAPSGYRAYGEDVLDRLRFIRSAQAVGLSLGEIRGIIALRDEGQPPHGDVHELLHARAEALERTIAELRTLQHELIRLVDRAAHLDPKDCIRDASATSSDPTMTAAQLRRDETPHQSTVGELVIPFR